MSSPGEGAKGATGKSRDFPAGSIVKKQTNKKKNPPASAGDTETWVQSLGQEESLEKEMATHSSILTWRIPWTEDKRGGYSL